MRHNHHNPGISDPPPRYADLLKRVTFTVVPEKASIGASGDIKVDRAYWSQLPESSRKFLLYHEMAHHQRTGCAGECPGFPLGCERCADERAGACLAAEGYTLRQTADAAIGAGFRSRTTTPYDAQQGWALYRTKAGMTAPATTSPDQSPPVMSKPAPRPTQPPAGTSGDIGPGVKVPPPSRDVDGINVPTKPVQPGCGSCNSCEWLVGVAGGCLLLGALLVSALET